MSKEEKIKTILAAYKEVEEDITILQSNIAKAKEYLSKDIEDIDCDYFDKYLDIEKGLKHIKLF